MNMRTVSFTEHLELEFEGNVLKNAICLGDVDNDGLNELVVGNAQGDVAIFKGHSTKPACTAKVLGTVTAVAVGDILHLDRNVLIVITACGQCRLYDFDKEPIEDCTKKGIVPIHLQKIPANVKMVYVGDINNDGSCEVILGLTDRVVRTYRWVSASDAGSDKLAGKLVGLNKWEFAEQIGTITLHESYDRSPCIIVAQPSGTFIPLKVDSLQLGEPLEPLDESMGEFLTKTSMNIGSMAPAKLRNSEICGNIITKHSGEPDLPCLAIATLDGVLMLVRNGKTLWKRSFDHELFAVNSVDLTQDGSEEVVACAWDGNTFIVNHDNEAVHFAFHEPVNTFTAGLFGLKKKQTPCFVYVSFYNKIYLYHDVALPYMTPKSLLETLEGSEEYKSLVQSLGVDVTDVDKLRELNRAILYGFN